MSRLLVLLAFGVAFAILKALLIILLIALLLGLVTCFIVRPRGTLVLLGGLGLLALANAQPLACIITLGIVGVVAVLSKAKRKSPGRLLLTDAGEHHSN